MRAPDAPTSEILQAALTYAERGWHVFPCHPQSKRPVVENGLLDATCDEQTIREWWKRWPGAMIGMRTGPESGVWVTDLDISEGVDGVSAIERLAEEKEPLPETITAKTPRGGRHLFWKWVEGTKNSAGKISDGVDVRGANGYVILAPSMRADGKCYQTLIDCSEPSEAPQWLIDLVVTDDKSEIVPAAPNSELETFANAAARHRGSNGVGYGNTALENECRAVATAVPGTRNATLNRAAFSLGQLVAGGVLNEADVRLRLRDAANACGLLKDDGAAQVTATLNSGLSAGMQKPREVPCSSSSPPPSPSSLSSLPLLPSHSSPSRSGEQQKQTTRPLAFIKPGTAWADKPIPPREWSTLNRFPLRQVALLSGEGAIGKSIVLMQLCCAHALAKDWLGAMPEPGAAIYFGCEDETDELHRRFADIVSHYGAPMAELTDLHLMSFAGESAILGQTNKSGLVEATPLFARLKQAACDIKPKLIGLDTASDIFAGAENDRSQVRQFLSMLRGLAIAANCTVIVCSHPSLTGISSGTGLSGSTAWHNGVRARCYMHTATTDEGEEPDPELRQLDFMKNQYGPIAERVLLRWKNGVFVPEPATGSLEKAAADQKMEDLFLTLLRQFEGQNRNVSHHSTANSFAPSAFAKTVEGKGKRKELAAAMERLFTSGRIKVESYGRPSRQASRIVRTST